MSLSKQAISGSKWNSLSVIIRTVIQLFQMVLLAKLLTPRDYGLVGMMSFFIGLSAVLVDMGLSSAIIHVKDINSKQLSTLFWLNILLGFVLFIVITIFSPLIAILYKEAQIREMIIYMGLGLFVNSFSFQHNILLLKDLKFKESAIFNIGSQILLFIISISMALLNFGVYSLIVPNIIVTALASILIIYYLRENYLPQFYFSFASIKNFINFSLFQTGSNLLNFVNSQIDTLIIGYYFGAEKFGYYYVAKNLVLRPIQIVIPIVSTVTGPLMSKINNEHDRLLNAYSKIIHFTSLLLFPIYLLMFLFAKPLIETLYGVKWHEAIFPLQLLSFIYILRGLISPIGSLVVATGKAKEMFYYNVILSFLFPVSLFLGNYYGIKGMLYAQLYLMVMLLFLHFYIMLKPLIKSITLTNFISFFSQNLLINIILFLPSLLLIYFFPHNNWIYFFIFIFYGTGNLYMNLKYNIRFIEILSHLSFKSPLLSKILNKLAKK